MSRTSSNRSLVELALAMGAAVPILYFGIQLAAFPFYPGYDFASHDASTLGSDGSTEPWIFNVGSIVIGVMTFVAAWGFWRAFGLLKIRGVAAWLTAAALVCFGAASINAGVFPLPYPRHTAGFFAVLGIGSFLLPMLLPVAMWRLEGAGRLRRFLITNIVVIIALAPIISGLVQGVLVKTHAEWPGYQDFLNNYHGLLQRVAALVIVAPIGAAACVLAGRVHGRPTASDR